MPLWTQPHCHSHGHRHPLALRYSIPLASAASLLKNKHRHSFLLSFVLVKSAPQGTPQLLSGRSRADGPRQSRCTSTNSTPARILSHIARPIAAPTGHHSPHPQLVPATNLDHHNNNTRTLLSTIPHAPISSTWVCAAAQRRCSGSWCYCMLCDADEGSKTWADGGRSQW